jgi:ATP-dependent RNA helicase DDX24/MAK5
MAKRKITNKQEKHAKRQKAVHVDSLPWKTVELPEMFDDAEGFYGLEEVSGVDVVREGEKIQFVSRPMIIFCARA